MVQPTKKVERQSRFELRTLLETSRLLIESQDPDFVLNNLLLISMGKLMATRSMFLQYNPGGEGYLVLKAKGADKKRENDTIALEVAPSIREKSVLYGKEYESVFDSIGVHKKSVLFNLTSNNYHIGYICLGPKANNEAYSPHELEFIESLATISSAAISNSRLLNELKYINRRLDRKVHDLNTLLQLSNDFNMMVNRDEIVRVFKFAMLGQMLIRTFFFVLETSGKKSVVSTSGLKNKPQAEELEYLYSLDDVAEIKPDSPCSFLTKNEIKLVIGLRFQNEKIGVVGLGAAANKKEFSESDINFLQSLGNLALLAIQKTLLLEESMEMQRLEEELNLAKSIQQGFLPEPLPRLDGFDIAAVNVSSRQVGGDYYDLITTPDKGHVIAIADVTGKGVPAALLMANLQSMLHALAPIDIDLSEATSSINDIIYKNTPADKFITFFWGKISNDGKHFNYVNAGHNPPFLLRKNQSIPIFLDKGGLILGALPSTEPYCLSEVEFQPGDVVTFYTDGVTEALNPAQTEEYGEQRLLDCVLKNRDNNSQQIIDAVLEDIAAFSDNVQYDDITLIVLKAG